VSKLARHTALEVLAFAALVATAYAEPAGTGASLREWFSSADFDAIRSPDRVESLPVESLADPSKDRKGGIKTSLPGSFRILPEPLPVDKDIATDLARLLLQPESYDPFYKGCIFEPGITFRFWKDGRALDAFLCFHCEDLGFQVVGASEALGGKLSFGSIRSRLAQLVRKARPSDSRFSQLK
jgi:hypothetical protein